MGYLTLIIDNFFAMNKLLESDARSIKKLNISALRIALVNSAKIDQCNNKKNSIFNAIKSVLSSNVSKFNIDQRD